MKAINVDDFIEYLENRQLKRMASYARMFARDNAVDAVKVGEPISKEYQVKIERDGYKVSVVRA